MDPPLPNHPEAARQIGAVILAAGAGSRMGGLPKPLITRDGEPLLLRQIRLLAEAGVRDIVVVLGYYAMQVSGVLEKTRWSSADSPIARTALKWTINPRPDEGTASSLRCGLKRLPPERTDCLVVLGDQPLLEAGDITQLLSTWAARQAGTQLLLPVHDGAPGHPLIFGSPLRVAVLAGQSVPQWRKAHADQVQVLPLDHARCHTDMDTPEDLLRLQEQWGVRLQLPSS